MSTEWDWVCTSHVPSVAEEGDVNDSGLERMRKLYAARTEILAAVETLRALDFDVWNFGRPEQQAINAFRKHPTCRLIARSESGQEVEL